MKISRTSNFKRDYKKFKKKHYDMDKLAQVIKLIINGEKETLRTQYHDHMLKGQYAGFRELHIEKHWLLVYKVDNDQLILTLIRTGTHDDLF